MYAIRSYYAREIGIRKAIGAKKMDILMQFVIEAVVLCLAGGILGLGLGYLGMQVAGSLMDITVRMSLSTIILALSFSIAVGLIFGIYPANNRITSYNVCYTKLLR